jgi:hypothetical protein
MRWWFPGSVDGDEEFDLASGDKTVARRVLERRRCDQNQSLGPAAASPPRDEARAQEWLLYACGRLQVWPEKSVTFGPADAFPTRLQGWSKSFKPHGFWSSKLAKSRNHTMFFFLFGK